MIMKMKKILTVITISIGLVFSSCNWDDFGDLNVNPNQATTPTTRALLTNAMISVGGLILSTQGALYAQHISNKQYTSADN
jgi:hypothetical protein